jgi:hypothetical protein
VSNAAAEPAMPTRTGRALSADTKFFITVCGKGEDNIVLPPPSNAT